MMRIAHVIAALVAPALFSASPAQAQLSADNAAPVAETIVQPAVDGIFEAFERHPLVGLGDDHGLAQGMDLYIDLVRDPRFSRDIGNVVVEFGAAGRQDVIDRYLAGEVVPYAELRSVWTDTVGWIPTAGLLGFAEFFAAVREANKTLPPTERIRVWLGEPPIDWSTATADDFMSAMGARDRHPADLIINEILAKNEKALVIYGGFHFATAQPPDRHSLRSMVEEEHPGAFFIVMPYALAHQPEACAPLLEQAATIWPQPALAAPAAGGVPDAVMRECATLDGADLVERGLLITSREPPVVDGHGTLFLAPLDALARGPGLPDLYLDAEYRLAINGRSEDGARPLSPFPAGLSLRKTDFEVDLDAPGYAELLDAMFAEHDKNGDGVVTADEYVDPIPR